MKREKTILIILVVLLIITLLCCWFVFRKVAQRDPWQEQYDLGTRYLNDGNYQEAVIAFLAAIDIDPWQPPAYSGAAQAYMGLGDRDAAVAILAQGAEFTGDEGLAAELEALRSSDMDMALSQEPEGPITEEDLKYWIPDGSSEVIAVTARVIENGVIYGEQWEAYQEQYEAYDRVMPDGSREKAVSLLSYGIRFDPAVTVEINGVEVSVSEANLSFRTEQASEVDDEAAMIHDENGSYPAIQVIGYFTRHPQTEELAGDESTGQFEYRPNGDYQFHLIRYELVEGSESTASTAVTVPGETTPEGASDMMMVPIQIIHNSEVYRSQWNAYEEQYRESEYSVGISAYGVRFIPAVTVEIDGTVVTISEANFAYGSYCDASYFRDNGLVENESGRDPVIQAKGYFVRASQTEEVELEEYPSGEMIYTYRPNGEYEFVLVGLELPEA